MKNIVLLISLLLSSSIFGAVKKGGTFKMNLGQLPKVLHPLAYTDAYASRIHEYTFDSLLIRDLDTYEWREGLASEWNISKDGMTFEFTLREGATFHDGKPITIEDVKFSYEAIVDPKNKYKVSILRPYFDSIESAKVIGKNKIQFKANKKYFQNFDVVAGMAIIPKHFYLDASKENMRRANKEIVGSGPYKLDEIKKGKYLTLVRNKKWWGWNVKHLEDRYNFDKILMRFISDSTIEIQRAERGDLDYIGLDPEQFVKKTTGSKWGKEIKKIKTTNKMPRGYSFIGWNLKNPLFKSKKTRKALAMLVNRKEMADKFLFNMVEQATGPMYVQSPYCPKNVKPIEFDPKKALELLRDDGWKDTDGDQILDKVIDGKKVKFSFTIMEPLQEFVKYLTIFKEDAKKAGIDINIKFIEWNSFIKLLDEKNFEAVRLAWTSVVDWDPKQIWHTGSIKDGSNFISYSNSNVDKLIDEARMVMDRDQRIKLLDEVYKTIADDAPYVFFFNQKYTMYGHAKNIKKPKDTFQYAVGLEYWSL